MPEKLAGAGLRQTELQWLVREIDLNTKMKLYASPLESSAAAQGCHHAVSSL